MRLTLRTLLAYLDGALAPAESQEIAQKLQTSPLATTLAGRIGDLLIRGDGDREPTLDPNLVAGYLDNALQPDQVIDVETFCLASDAQLEEVAACHKLLFLGSIAEPTSSTAGRDRLYALAPGANQHATTPSTGMATIPRVETTICAPRWYYRRFGQEFGPVPIDRLIQVIATGQLQPDDVLRADSSGTWVRVRDFLASPATIEKNVASDSWFCQSKHVEPGPHTFEDLLFHARQGALEPNDQIRFGSQGPWRRAGSIGRLMAEMPYQRTSAINAPVTTMPPTVMQTDENDELVLTVPLRDVEPAPTPVGISSPVVAPAIPPVQAPPMPLPDEWYVQLGSMTCGPMRLTDLLHWVRAGRLQPTDPVRRGSTSAWVKASTLPSLIAPAPTPAVPSPPRPAPLHLPQPPASPTTTPAVTGSH